jgi:hypothetical protein
MSNSNLGINIMKPFFKISILAVVGLFGLVAPYAHAAKVELGWDKPAMNADFDGYKIYYVEDSPDFEKGKALKVTDPNQTSVEIDGLLEGGVYYFCASTFKEESGQILESPRTGAMTYLVPGEYAGEGGSGIGDIIGESPASGGGGGGGGGCFIAASSSSS